MSQQTKQFIMYVSLAETTEKSKYDQFRDILFKIFLFFILILLCLCLVYLLVPYDHDLDNKNRIVFPNVVSMSSDGTATIFNNDCSHDHIGTEVLGDTIPSLSHPWLALLDVRYKDGTPLSYQCGGALINKRYILTAGHCLPQFSDKGHEVFEVALGSHNFQNDSYYENGNTLEPQYFDIEEIIIHEQYLENSNQHDIGLIRLAKDVDISVKNIQPICLMDKIVELTVNDLLTVTSWGLNGKYFNLTPDTPHRERLPYIPRDECQKSYLQKGIQIYETHICAGGEKGVDPCLKSSGNPLVRHVDGAVYVEGIASIGGTPCGVEGVPLAFTHVPQYINWIRDNLRM